MVAVGERAREHGDGEKHAGVEENGKPVEGGPVDRIA